MIHLPDSASTLLPSCCRIRAALVPPARWISANVGETIKRFGIDEMLYFQSSEKLPASQAYAWRFKPL